MHIIIYRTFSLPLSLSFSPSLFSTLSLSCSSLSLLFHSCLYLYVPPSLSLFYLLSPASLFLSVPPSLPSPFSLPHLFPLTPLSLSLSPFSPSSSLHYSWIPTFLKADPLLIIIVIWTMAGLGWVNGCQTH